MSLFEFLIDPFRADSLVPYIFIEFICVFALLWMLVDFRFQRKKGVPISRNQDLAFASILIGAFFALLPIAFFGAFSLGILEIRLF